MTSSPSISEIDLSLSASRLTLAPQPKPYWAIIESGLHIGYYKGARASAWYARRFIGAGKYKQTKLGLSNDEGRPGNRSGLSYEDAVAAALDWNQSSPSMAPSTTQEQEALPRTEDVSRRLKPSRLDNISQVWARERPDVDFWLAGFFLRLEYAHYQHERRLADISQTAGVNVGDLHVLLALRRSGPEHAMRPTDLFRELLITSGAITKRIDRLGAKKMIERVAASEDRRSELVKLTARGAAVADAAMTRISSSLAAIVAASGVTTEELKATDACFRRLIEKM